MRTTLTLLIFTLATFGLSAQNISATNAPAVSGMSPLSQPIIIPVVVHVVYNSVSQNISESQIMSQIEVLNKDFNGTNSDISKVPSYFAPLAGKSGFTFQLAKMDPSGQVTNGIIRKPT